VNKYLNFIAPAFYLAFLLYPIGSANAVEIMNDKQCQSALKDVTEAVDENPAIGDKAEKILMEVIALARQRCDEKQYDNAKDLLDLARGMVASE